MGASTRESYPSRSRVSEEKASIEYYDNVKHRNKEEFLRLYLRPGVYHCGGGPGPSEINWLDVMSGWVERNEPPHRLQVTKRDDQGCVVMTRPIYPYPIYVRYKGSGDPNRAESFEPVHARAQGARIRTE